MLNCIVCKTDLNNVSYYTSHGKINNVEKDVWLCDSCFKDRQQHLTVSFETYFEKYFN